jgi:hypothetical protein
MSENTKAEASRMMTIDLFWEPSIGDLVNVRTSSRCGVRAFDDYPLRVTKRSVELDTVIFNCETTGPKTTRTTPRGRVVDTTNRWTGFYTADQLLPAEARA